jgi:hypothetical protein
MDFSQYVVPMIAAGVYLVLLMIKGVLPEGFKKFLPLVAGLLGVVLYSWNTMTFSFATFVGGLASGLAATGIDQVISIAQNKKSTTGTGAVTADPKEKAESNN